MFKPGNQDILLNQTDQNVSNISCLTETAVLGQELESKRLA